VIVNHKQTHGQMAAAICGRPEYTRAPYRQTDGRAGCECDTLSPRYKCKKQSPHKIPTFYSVQNIERTKDTWGVWQTDRQILQSEAIPLKH